MLIPLTLRNSSPGWFIRGPQKKTDVFGNPKYCSNYKAALQNHPDELLLKDSNDEAKMNVDVILR